jgi:hypothetical protein
MFEAMKDGAGFYVTATNGAVSLCDVATVCLFGRTAVHRIGAAAMNVIHPPRVARKDGARSDPGAGQISVESRARTACWSNFYAPEMNENDTLKNQTKVSPKSAPTHAKSDVETRKIGTFKPDSRNANKGTGRGQQMIENSLRNFGDGR